MSERNLPPSSYALLGLLGHGDAAGYELGTIAMRTIGHFWPLTRTHVYGELTRLENLGYVEATEVSQRRRPDKRVYSLTSSGREALVRWLDDGELPVERNRIPELVKVFFGGQMHPDRWAELIREYRARTAASREELASTVDDLAKQGAEAMFALATALYGLRHLDATMAWLDEFEAMLAKHGSARSGRRTGR